MGECEWRLGGAAAEAIPPQATPWVEWDAIWDACQNALVPGGAAYYCSTSENVVGTSEWLASHADLRADGEVDKDIRRRILGCPQHRAVLQFVTSMFVNLDRDLPV